MNQFALFLEKRLVVSIECIIFAKTNFTYNTNRQLILTNNENNNALATRHHPRLLYWPD